MNVSILIVMLSLCSLSKNNDGSLQLQRYGIPKDCTWYHEYKVSDIQDVDFRFHCNAGCYIEFHVGKSNELHMHSFYRKWM